MDSPTMTVGEIINKHLAQIESELTCPFLRLFVAEKVMLKLLGHEHGSVNVDGKLMHREYWPKYDEEMAAYDKQMEEIRQSLTV